MNKRKFLFFCTFFFVLLVVKVAYSQDKIVLKEQFYQDGNYSIGMLNPVDMPMEQYKPEGMDYDVVKHVSRIGNIELTAVYLNYARAPQAHSFWDEDSATRGAFMAAILATEVPMSQDFGFTKLSETDSETADYKQKDIYYGLLVDAKKYVFAFKFIRRSGDEYVLAYKAPIKDEPLLSPQEYFDTFKLVK